MKKIFLLISAILFCMAGNSQTVGLIQHNTGSLDDGYVLFAPFASTTTYLIDKCGRQVKTWSSEYMPGQSAYFLPDGNLLRTGDVGNTTFNIGGKGGIVEKINWDGEVIWSYTVSDALKLQHHDIAPLPNGNVLVIAWELKTADEAIAAGRNPSLVSDVMWSEQILEIQPVGQNGGNIVWQWHLWDHLVQDYDSTKANYGDIASAPGLVNLNYEANNVNPDWIHMNSIDYNADLDQILVSAHNLNEIWVIDHSTTTGEAATHTGGNAGKGGDILYRWGNPAAYNNGTASDQRFFGQHNAHWVPAGLPYANQIMVFNNGLSRTDGNYSTVEVIDPPLNGFTYNNTLPYLPAADNCIYNCDNPYSFFAPFISGAQQLSNGNLLLCNGPDGYFREVTADGIPVWTYVNPVYTSGILPQGSDPAQNIVFRCTFYPSGYSGFTGHTLTAGDIIEDSNSLSASCSLLASDVISENKFTVYPNPARQFLMIKDTAGLLEGAGVLLYTVSGQLVYNGVIEGKLTKIPLSGLAGGLYFLQITSNKGMFTRKVMIEN